MLVILRRMVQVSFIIGWPGLGAIVYVTRTPTASTDHSTDTSESPMPMHSTDATPATSAALVAAADAQPAAVTTVSSAWSAPAGTASNEIGRASCRERV